MRDGLQPGQVGRSGNGLDLFNSIGKAAAGTRQLEDHVAHAAPGGIVWRLSSNNAGELVESAASEPELAVQRMIGQGVEKSLRGGDGIATAKPQALAIPDGAHAVKFFADPVTRDIDTVVIPLGQEQGRG